MPNKEDTIIRAMFLSGDDGVYAYLYQKHVRMLFAYGMRFTRDREIVKDGIHDVFVKLYNKRSGLAHVSQMKAYLLACLRNELFDTLRRERNVRFTEGDFEPLFSLDYTAEEQMIAVERRAEEQIKLRRILSILTTRQKEVFYYRYILGMGLTEICEVMGINYQSLQNLIQRSIQRVREMYNEREEAAKADDRMREKRRMSVF